VAYRSQAGRFVEQHQWDAPGFTDPRPILQWRIVHYFCIDQLRPIGMAIA
jgi:hypothetical protein